MNISQEQAQEMLRTLMAIDRRARTTYKARVGHDEDIAMIGMMAENAILKVDEGYNGRT